MRAILLLVAFWLLLLCNCAADDDDGPGPDAALPRCVDLPGCEHASICNRAGECVCTRAGEEPITCTLGEDTDAGGAP